MPKIFEKLGISFQYPDNWTLDEEDAIVGGNSVTVYSPGGSFWSVAVHPGYANPAQLATSAMDAMKEEYDELEIEDAHETVTGHELVGHNLSFYYLDLTSTAYINQTQGAVGLTDLSLGLIKGVVFGVLVAVAGCMRGMQSGSSSAAVGLAATSAVVTGIVAIIVTDAVFAVVTNVLGI